jgi:hypothetical protein
VKAIETRYAGCRFRSRLEARWAVFFDVLKIEWEYEPQGFHLPSGPYLPDFRLPNHRRWDGDYIDTWVEVKGRLATAREYQLLWEMTRADPLSSALMLEGDIPRTPHLRDGVFFRGACTMNDEWSGPRDYVLAEGPNVQNALNAARSARFEHGESGAPASVPYVRAAAGPNPTTNSWAHHYARAMATVTQAAPPPKPAQSRTRGALSGMRCISCKVELRWGQARCRCGDPVNMPADAPIIDPWTTAGIR